MKLFVQYPTAATVLIDGVAAGVTNQSLSVSPGRYRIQVDDEDGTDPQWLEIDLAIDAPDNGIGPEALSVIRFTPRQRPINRLSPLYSLYNGFMLGQFMAVSFAAYARAGYAERRMRMQEFLDEIDAVVTLPEHPPTFGGDEYHALVADVMRAVAFESQELAELALLGLQLVIYGHLAATGDEATEVIAAEVERLRQRHGLPAPDLPSFVPELQPDGSVRIDELLSSALVYLSQAVSTLEMEPDTAFVIMPFVPPYAGYFATFYRPSLEAAGCRAFRAWGGLSNEDYCDLLLALIGRCGLVWADVSDRNPNVFYETGAAHAMGKVAVLLVHEAQVAQVPANIGHDAVMRYDPAEPDWPQRTIQVLALTVAALRLAAETGRRVRINRDGLAATLETVSKRLRGIVIPPEADDALQQGRDALRAGDSELARQLLDRAIALGSNDSDSFALRAMARFALDDAEGTIADLHEALERNESPASGLYRLRGLARNQLDENIGAEADFSRVLAHDPTDADVWFFRGMAREGLAQWADALADYEQAVARGSEHPQLQEQLVLLRGRR